MENTLTNPEFTKATASDFVDVPPLEENELNPIEYIDEKLKERNVEDYAKWRSRFDKHLNASEEGVLAGMPLKNQIYTTNRILRLYLGKMEENTRGVRCAVIDGIEYNEWKDLINEHVIPVLEQHITTGKWEYKLMEIPEADEEGNPIVEKEEEVIVQP